MSLYRIPIQEYDDFLFKLSEYEKYTFSELCEVYNYLNRRVMRFYYEDDRRILTQLKKYFRIERMRNRNFCCIDFNNNRKGLNCIVIQFFN